MNKKRKIIAKDKEESIIERLCDYILPVNPEWKNMWKPASEKGIEELRKKSGIDKTGYDLPISYIQYLRYMGEEDGGLLSHGLYGAETKLSAILKYYQKDSRNILFARCHEEGEFYITTKENGEQIITTDFMEEYEIDQYAESFEKLLCQEAYFIYGKKYLKEKIDIGIDKSSNYKEIVKKIKIKKEDIFDKLEKYTEKYGYKKAWYSDKWHYIGIKEEISFDLDIIFGVGGDIIGDNIEEMEEIQKHIQKFLEEI